MSTEGVASAESAVIPVASRLPRRRRLPDPEEVAPGVWAIASPIPHGSIPYTLSYLLEGESGEVHIIDPGWGSAENVDALRASMRSLGHELEQLRTIVATHFHPDHLGIASTLRDLTGARLLFSAVERRVLAQANEPGYRDTGGYLSTLHGWAVPEQFRPALLELHGQPAWVADVEPDGTLADPEVLQLSGHALRVIATPGHTDGHICLADEDRRLLYTGDHVLPRIFGGIGLGTLPGSDPLADYFDSLERLAPFDAFDVLPGHERRFTGLGERRRRIVRHHLRRSAEVEAIASGAEAPSVWDVARQMEWTGGWESLEGFMLHSALRQTEMHLEFVRNGRAHALRERVERAESGA